MRIGTLKETYVADAALFDSRTQKTWLAVAAALLARQSAPTPFMRHAYLQAVHETGARLTHDVKNLFLCDGSSMVTSGRGQPTLTIEALAFRAADHINRFARANAI